MKMTNIVVNPSDNDLNTHHVINERQKLKEDNNKRSSDSGVLGVLEAESINHNTSLMSNKDTTTQQNIQNSTCEAVGCYSKASIEIHLKVGTKGMIPLFLCAECMPKLCPDDNNCVNLRCFEAESVLP